MATYVIGDIQGCLSPFKHLLDAIDFNERTDTLWLVGDLVNRGPQSYQTLKFIHTLGEACVCVLGNHDLTLLLHSIGGYEPKDQDTFQEVLGHQDSDELLDWLKSRPLIHYDKGRDVCMTHAGVYPLWSIEQALSYADEVQQVLTGPKEGYQDFLNCMFGQTPELWSDKLTGSDRLRFIVNAFTRMRFCRADGSLDLFYKGSVEDSEDNVMAWFAYPEPKWSGTKLIFGHWAALDGKSSNPDVYALDTGCVWGRCLSALNLDTMQVLRVDCG